MEQLSEYGPEAVAGMFVLLAGCSIVLTWMIVEFIFRKMEESDKAKKEENARYRIAMGLSTPEQEAAIGLVPRHRTAPKEESSAAKILRKLKEERESHNASSIMTRLQEERELTNA